MSTLQQVFLGIFLLLGSIEIVSNLYHLTRRSLDAIARSAGKQHGEIPKNLTPGHYVVKAIIMEVFGVLFGSVGLIMLVRQQFLTIPVLITLGLFGGYALIQALIYNAYPPSWGAALVYNLPLIGYLVFS